MRETKRAKWRKQRRQCPELRKSSRAFPFISQHPESKPLFTNTTSVSFWNYSNKPQAISNKLQWRHGSGSERQREHPLLLFPLHFSLSASGLAYQLSEQQNTVERQAVRSPTGAAEDLQRLSSRLQLPGLQRPSSTKQPYQVLWTTGPAVGRRWHAFQPAQEWPILDNQLSES